MNLWDSISTPGCPKADFSSRELDLCEVMASLGARRYDLLDPIGHGHSAVCYRVRDVRYPGELFCAKIGDADPGDSASEVDTLISLTHPNVISIFARFTSAHYSYVILEYCGNGSLHEMIAARGGLARDDILVYARQLLQALAYLHEHSVCHRDIKPANILLDKHGRAKLADFGFASHGEVGRLRICGSLPYMSPELHKKVSSNPEADDVWALGVTFYEMTFGKRPWDTDGRRELGTAIGTGLLQIPSDTLPQWTAVLRRMLNTNPRARGTPREILEMPFFTGATGPRSSASQAILPRLGAMRPALPKRIGPLRGYIGTLRLPRGFPVCTFD
jgi:serine/threonine protein kinase